MIKILIILLFIVFLSGCVDNELVDNVYIGNEGDIVRFFSDGNMHYTTSDGIGSTGTYIIEDGRVYFNAGFWTWDADIINDTLVNNGYIMIKQ